jgi:hypothetical protein
MRICSVDVRSEEDQTMQIKEYTSTIYLILSMIKSQKMRWTEHIALMR